MGRAEGDAAATAAAPRTVNLTDAQGRVTDDPAAAVRGEIVDRDDHGRPRRRVSFFLSERELPWLPVSEAAFLLWVLALLMLVWIGVGLLLVIT